MGANHNALHALDAGGRIPDWNAGGDTSLIILSSTSDLVATDVKGGNWKFFTLTESSRHEDFVDELRSTSCSLGHDGVEVLNISAIWSITPVIRILKGNDTTILDSLINLCNVLVNDLLALLLESLFNGLLPDLDGLILVKHTRQQEESSLDGRVDSAWKTDVVGDSSSVHELDNKLLLGNHSSHSLGHDGVELISSLVRSVE